MSNSRVLYKYYGFDPHGQDAIECYRDINFFNYIINFIELYSRNN